MSRSIPALMLGLALLGAVACGGGRAQGLTVASSTSIATPRARAEPRLALSADRVPQGSAFTVRVRGDGLQDGLVRAGTRTFRLGQTNGGLWAAIAVGPDEQPGLMPIAADVTDDRGTVRTLHAGVAIVPHEFPLDRVALEPTTAALLDQELVAREERLLQAALRGFTPATADFAAGFRRPIEGQITTMFGAQRVYSGRRVETAGGRHGGMDIAAKEGQPVVAAAGGVVALAEALPERGNYVLIDHGLGVFTGYGHLSELRVTKGTTVTAGETVGLAGSTGLSTGPHLHWDAIAQGVFFDPQALLDGALSG